jgi:hypothetical protein
MVKFETQAFESSEQTSCFRLFTINSHTLSQASSVASQPSAMALPARIPSAAGAPTLSPLTAPTPPVVARVSHATRTALKQHPPARGALQVMRAAATFEMSEWELYRAEYNFHQRTLQLVQAVTKTLKQEWDTYRTEMATIVMAPSTGTAAAEAAAEATYNQVVQLVEAAVAAEADFAEDGMHPGGEGMHGDACTLLVECLLPQGHRPALHLPAAWGSRAVVRRAAALLPGDVVTRRRALLHGRVRAVPGALLHSRAAPSPHCYTAALYPLPIVTSLWQGPIAPCLDGLPCSRRHKTPTPV